MQVYLIVFFLSTLFLYFSEKFKGKKIKRFYLFLGLILPCFLGGIRHYSIGTDVSVYLKPLYLNVLTSYSFTNFLSSCWWDIWTYKHVANFEYGFNLIVYFVTRWTENFQLLMFTIQTLIILPIYFGLKKYKELEGKTWFAMLTFYLLLYNNSYNVMRQYIGISMLFYGASCLLNEKKTIKFFVFLTIAFLFHKSSLMGIAIYILYKIFNSKSKNGTKLIIGEHKLNVRNIFIVMLLLIGILMISNLSQIVELLDYIGLTRYIGYISGEVYFKSTNLIKILPVIFLFILNRKSIFTKSKNSHLLVIFFCIDFLSTYLSSVNIYAARIGYLFQIFSIISYTHIVFSTENKIVKRFNKIFMLAYLIYYWYFTYVQGGAGHTVPFMPYWN